VEDLAEVCPEEEGGAAGHENSGKDAVVFLFLQLFVGQLLKQFSAWSGVPYTSLITVAGCVVGAAASRMPMALCRTVVGWSHINPHDLLMLFLPALIFESAMGSDWHIFKMELA